MKFVPESVQLSKDLCLRLPGAQRASPHPELPHGVLRFHGCGSTGFSVHRGRWQMPLLFSPWQCSWKSLSCVWLSVTPWIIQSMELSRPEHWGGYPFPSPGDLPNPGIKPVSHIVGGFFTSRVTREAWLASANLQLTGQRAGEYYKSDTLKSSTV